MVGSPFDAEQEFSADDEVVGNQERRLDKKAPQSSARIFVCTHDGAVKCASRKMPPVRRTDRAFPKAGQSLWPPSDWTNSQVIRSGDHSSKAELALYMAHTDEVRTSRCLPSLHTWADFWSVVGLMPQGLTSAAEKSPTGQSRGCGRMDKQLTPRWRSRN